MKRSYFFVLSVIMALLGFKGYAQDSGTATVVIDGEFYTFSAQDVDEPRNEAFAFDNARTTMRHWSSASTRRLPTH